MRLPACTPAGSLVSTRAGARRRFFYTIAGPLSHRRRARDHRMAPRAQELAVAGRQWQLEFEGAPTSARGCGRCRCWRCARAPASRCCSTDPARIAARSEAGLAQKAHARAAHAALLHPAADRGDPNPVFYKDARDATSAATRVRGLHGAARGDLGKTVFDVATPTRRPLAAPTGLLHARQRRSTSHCVPQRATAGARGDLQQGHLLRPLGPVAGIVGVSWTSPEEALEAARASAETLRAVIQARRSRSSRATPTKRHHDVEPRAERMFGWTEAEVLNTRHLDRAHAPQGRTEAMRRAPMGASRSSSEETQRQPRRPLSTCDAIAADLRRRGPRAPW
jgi:PAS domain-containing protein